MKFFICSFLLFCSLLSNAQSWNFIGSSSGIASASEIDMEIGSNQNLFIAYVDVANTNKITVRKFNTTLQTWQLVGPIAFTGSNAFDVQMALINDSTPVIAYKRTITISSTNYNVLEVYRYNHPTSNWVGMGLSDPIVTNHSKDFSIRTNTAGQVFLTFYNQLITYPTGLVTINMSATPSPTALGSDIDDGNLGNAIASCVSTGNNVYVTDEQNDIGDYLNLHEWNGTTFDSYGLNGSNDALKLKMNISPSSATRVTSMWSREFGTTGLYFKTFNATTNAFGTQATVHSGTIVDFDYDMYGDDSYAFYRSGSTCFLKKVTTALTPTVSTLFSGTTLAPGTATSLCVEKNLVGNVIAYIDGGMCYVKEQNLLANIEDVGVYQMCEGSALNTGNSVPAVLVLDDYNYTHSSLTMTVTSQNTAIIPQSGVSTSAIPGSSNLKWKLIITNTNDVPSPTLVDLEFELFENGVSVGTAFVTVTVNPKPDILFLITDNDVCENAPIFSLAGKAIPLGGTWSGPGVLPGNNFNASLAPLGVNTLTYTVSNSYGCSNSSSTAGNILETPDLSVSVINADCGEENGSATVSITGGLAPYDINWSNNQSTSTISDLAADQYFVIVEDANGCKRSAPAMVGSTGLNQSGSVTPVECHGEATGQIALTLTGAVAPTTILWSNGSTSLTNSNLIAGTYEVTITDASGCVSVGSYTVGQAPLIQLTSVTQNPTSSCGASDGLIDATATGGIGALSLEYFDINNVAVANDPLTAEAGFYNLVVSDVNGCSQSFPLTINDPNGPVLALDTILSSSCSNDGEIQLINVGNSASSFLWSTSSTTMNLSNLAPGDYSLQAYNAAGCLTSYTYTVDATQPQDVEICLITVDTATNTNLLVWEKPVTNAIAYFNIYRETSTSGVYQLIDTVNYTSLSQFTDPVADPSVRSWRYKISAVDACGTEGELSAFHKTIHLSINLGLGGVYNLLWDQYEGFTYPEFKIMRYTNPGGWVVVDQLATTDFSYTDTPPTTNELDYFIEIVPPATCTSTKISDFNSSRSNRERGGLSVNPNSINENALENAFLLYPNPANETMNIENFTTQSVSLVITDVSGKIIAENVLQTGLSNINTSNWNNGLYFFTLEMNGEKITHRQVVQH